MLEGPTERSQPFVSNQQRISGEKEDRVEEEIIPDIHVSQETTDKTQGEFNRTFSQINPKVPSEKWIAELEQKVIKAKQDLNELKAEENKLNEEKKTKNNSNFAYAISEIQIRIMRTELKISSLENQLKAARPPSQEESVPIEKRNWKTRFANSRFVQLFKSAYKNLSNARTQSSIKSKEKRLNSIEEKFNKIEASQAIISKGAIKTANSFPRDLHKMIKESNNMKEKLDKTDEEYRTKRKQIDDIINRADVLLNRIKEFTS